MTGTDRRLSPGWRGGGAYLYHVMPIWTYIYAAGYGVFWFTMERVWMSFANGIDRSIIPSDSRSECRWTGRGGEPYHSLPTYRGSWRRVCTVGSDQRDDTRSLCSASPGCPSLLWCIFGGDAGNGRMRKLTARVLCEDLCLSTSVAGRSPAAPTDSPSVRFPSE